jgi:hypothetical protein
MLASSAFGHDGSVTFDIEIGDEPYEWAHEEASPFKGWANVTVTNTGTQPWGDFHFEFYDPIGGQDISNLAFLDGSGGGFDPCSTQSGLTWSIDNGAVGATMDLFFYSDPVAQFEEVTFSVYTDNTADELPWFGLMIYPTPIPEPATICLLGLGAIGLLRRKRSR